MLRDGTVTIASECITFPTGSHADDDSTVAVQMPHRSAHEPTFTFKVDATIPRRDIKQVIAVGTDGDLAREHMYNLGYRGVDGERWVSREEESRVDDVSRRVLFPIAEEAWDHELIMELQQSEESEDDGMCGYEDDGFVVPDDSPDCLWTPADEPSASDNSEGAQIVREMHQAARDWDAWHPQNPQESSAKDMISRMEAGARHRDDELRFAQGMTAQSYRPPPRRRG